MTAHGHLIERCVCGIVIRQCRCPASRKTERIVKPCRHEAKAPDQPVTLSAVDALAAPLTATFAKHPCRCVKTHSPRCNRTHAHHIWPLGMGGPDIPSNLVYICPTTHGEVHLILEAFQRAGRRLDRSREWGTYAYLLAVRGWEAREAGRTLGTQAVAEGDEHEDVAGP